MGDLIKLFKDKPKKADKDNNKDESLGFTTLTIPRRLSREAKEKIVKQRQKHNNKVMRITKKMNKVNEED